MPYAPPSVIPQITPAQGNPAGALQTPDWLSGFALPRLPSIRDIFPGLFVPSSGGGASPTDLPPSGGPPAIPTPTGPIEGPTPFTNPWWEGLVGGSPTPSVPSPPGAPQRPGGITVPSIGLPPGINTRPQTGPTGPTSLTLPGMPLPSPPQMDLSKVPQMGPMTGIDYSQARKFMEAGAPKAPDMSSSLDANTAAVLGGLARGAASVSATEPGSFAKALAAAGAGGSEGRRGEIEKGISRQDEYERERSRYNLARGTSEMQMAQHQAEIRNAQRQVDFQNAKSLWDADFQNRNLMYENQLKQYGLSRPQVHSAADGVIITSQNPDGSSKVEFMN